MTISKETNICISELKEEDGFPVDVFPEPIRKIIRETKATLSYPTDFIASAICFTLSVGIGNNFVAKVKEGWNERAILYMAIIGRSGVNKSHPLSFAMQPLFEQDIKSSVKYQKERREYEKYILASKKEKEDKEQAEEPVLKKFIVSDITPERLITIHQDNKRGICLYVDELMSWLKNFNRYNSGSEEQFWLSVFSGKPIILDRQGNKNSAFIKHSFISVIGTIQKGLLKELAKGERSENGFIDRILFVFPPHLKKEYWNELELSTNIAPLWAAIVKRLTDIQCATDEDGELIPNLLTFSTEARKLLYHWQHKNTDLCNSEMDEVLVGIYSKLDIYIIRFSLILQLSRWACDESDKVEIDSTSVKGAISIVEYFRITAQRVQGITNSSAALEQLTTDKYMLYNALPMEFSTGEGIAIAQKQNISMDSSNVFWRQERNTI